MNDQKYWEDYYKTHLNIGEPSPFAEFIIDKFKPNGTLIELGCGNGRDSIYFLKHNLKVTGVDQCPNVINNLNLLNLPGAQFVKDNFTDLPNHAEYNNIYSRFTLHSVGKKEASNTLDWAFNSLTKNGLLFIEVRSVKDELYGEGEQVEEDAWQTDHYRRFIRNDQLNEELEGIGFEILFNKEADGLAPYKDENPIIIRTVCTK